MEQSLRQEVFLPRDLEEAVEGEIERWERGGKVDRLWAGDASLWTDAGEGGWLGWLRATDDRGARREAMERLAGRVRAAGWQDAVVLGMGGSSLCPEVLARTFGRRPGHPRLNVLDSTAPAQVAALEKRVDLDSTLFVVSSKSGTTLETALLQEYFLARVSGAIGEERAAGRFIAVTDPGSKLEKIARGEADGTAFGDLYLGEPQIGGRFSALSPFGIVPAAIQGLDTDLLLRRGADMARACGPEAAARSNPGLLLGVTLGVAGARGLDKVTLLASPGIRSLGAWLEQLVAESTGKRGVALIPIDGEPVAAPEAYGDDRLFVYLRLDSAPDLEQDEAVETLRAAGRPVVRLRLREPYDLGGELFRWEFATAVAGSILGINPFDQPDVEASKVATREIMRAFEETGALPAEEPFREEGGIALFADEANYAEIVRRAGAQAGLAGCLAAHLDRLRPNDYLALAAWIEMSSDNDRRLQAIRQTAAGRRVASCLGYGPRFLHSTGQAHKGGPDSGVFVQITADPAIDREIPGRPYTFGTVLAAQARGDLEVLNDRGRRALRIHLGADVAAGLRSLRTLVA